MISMAISRRLWLLCLLVLLCGAFYGYRGGQFPTISAWIPSTASILLEKSKTLGRQLLSLGGRNPFTSKRTIKVQRSENHAVNKSVYISAHEYQGATFFDEWDFYNGSDYTHGSVQYVNSSTAFANHLAYITPTGQAAMQVDNRTVLTVEGINSGTELRQSVRMQTKRQFNQGLFILDVARAPWGCGTWPAFWSTGDNWPQNGEIDVIEQVHTNLNDKVSFHTNTGCMLTTPGNYTGVAATTNCSYAYEYNTGCGISSPSVASFGEVFNEKGGGVYATKWDDYSIDIWFFYRSAIPDDILDGIPDPSGWPLPDASLSGIGCPINDYFHNHNIIFDTTLCGDLAGSTYSTSGCPGNCTERVANPANFVNATWIINYLKIYNQTIINTSYLDDATRSTSMAMTWASIIGVLVTTWLMDMGNLLW